MISPESIQEIRDLNIESVISKYLPLKENGPRLLGHCPFHTENTPSFTVNPNRNIYKCFGCGKSGDGIGFVMDHEHITFIDAVKKIAADQNIELKQENVSPEQAQAMEKAASERKSIQILLDWATAFYQENEISASFVRERGFGEETLRTFLVGYAGSKWSDLYENAKKQQFEEGFLVKAGLILEKKDKTGFVDFFRERVIFPILDVQGRTVAFTARYVGSDKEEKLKYKNSPETTWTKGDYVFGLYQALKHIGSLGFVYLVEGPTDVLRFWQHGVKNVVATNGTSLTTNQINLIKRYTNRITIVSDNDEPKGTDLYGPGIKALQKQAEAFIKEGFGVNYLLPGEGHDPDSWLQTKIHTPEELKSWLDQRKNYISDWLFENCAQISEVSLEDKVQQVQRMAAVIESIPQAMMREAYMADMKDRWPDFKNIYKPAKTNPSNERDAIEKLKADQRSNLLNFGFFEKIDTNRGSYPAYYKNSKGAEPSRICTFTMKMHYFIRHETEPSYLVEFINIYGEKRIKAVKTDDFTSIPAFRKVLARLGSVFEFEGLESDLTALKIKLFYGVKQCREPIYMGQNSKGEHFVWSNGLYFDGSFHDADEYGIVQIRKAVESLDFFYSLPPNSQLIVADEMEIVTNLLDFENKIGKENIKELIAKKQLDYLQYHYLPYASRVLGEEGEDEVLDMRKMLRHFKVEGLKFEEWSKLMCDAYPNNGMVSVAFFIASLFRDIIYEANNNYFPLLFYFGKPQSGKSKCMDSLMSMFGDFIPDGINLHKGGSTELGIKRYLASVQNTIIGLNEYKNTLSDEKQEMLKSLADGGGRLTGKKSNNTATEAFVSRSSAVIAGQDLPTKEAALLTRIIPCEFVERSRNYEAYEALKRYEKDKKTTSVTCELLGYRKIVKEYPKYVGKCIKSVKEHLQSINMHKVDDRAIMNIVSLLVPYQLISEKSGMKMPFTYQQLKEALVERLKFQIEIQTAEDEIGKYFSVLMSMNKRGKFSSFKDGEHYMINREKLDENMEVNYLYLRLRTVHGTYTEMARRQQITPMATVQLEKMLRERKDIFVAQLSKNVQFRYLENHTSAWKFNYDRLMEMGIEFMTSSNLGFGRNPNYDPKKAGDDNTTPGDNMAFTGDPDKDDLPF